MRSISLPPPSFPPPHYFIHNFVLFLAIIFYSRLLITSKFYTIPGLHPVIIIFLTLRLILVLPTSVTYFPLATLYFTKLLNVRLQVCNSKFLIFLLETTKHVFFHHGDAPHLWISFRQEMVDQEGFHIGVL